MPKHIVDGSFWTSQLDGPPIPAPLWDGPPAHPALQDAGGATPPVHSAIDISTTRIVECPLTVSLPIWLSSTCKRSRMLTQWESLHESAWTNALLLALPALLVWQLTHWVYGQLTMSEAQRKAPKPPHPPFRMPLLGDTLSVAFNAQRMQDWHTELQDKFQSRPHALKVIGAPPGLVIATPELFEDVLKRQFDVFNKGPNVHEILTDLLGNGIFAVDGHRWVHQRKTASNLFTMKALRESMTKSVHKLLPVVHGIFHRSVMAQEPIDMVKLLNRFTIEGFAEIGFGVELGCLDAAEDHPFQAAFDSAQRNLFLRFIRPHFVWKLMRWIGVGSERELKKNIKVVDDTVLGIISQSLERRVNGSHSAGKERKQDIVSLFLDNVSHDSSGEDGPFDPIFLRDIVVNFLIAGRDTTAQTLSWFFYSLSQHPEVEQKLRAELASKREQFGGSLNAISMEQTQELVYLEAMLKETLRLYPSVPNNIRAASRDTVLSDGTFVKAGSPVVFSSYVMGRMEQVWGPDAKQFKPERWIDPHTGRIIPVSAYKFNSFHAGPRMCLGMNLAMMEMKMVVASLLSKFELELMPGQHITYDMSLTLPMKGAMFMRVKSVGK